MKYCTPGIIKQSKNVQQFLGTSFGARMGKGTKARKQEHDARSNWTFDQR